jgi:hypothetical protein
MALLQSEAVVCHLEQLLWTRVLCGLAVAGVASPRTEALSVPRWVESIRRRGRGRSRARDGIAFLMR